LQLTRQATPANTSWFIPLPNNLKGVPNLSHDTIGSVFFPEFTYVLERSGKATLMDKSDSGTQGRPVPLHILTLD
jgi:hypothetical protein